MNDTSLIRHRVIRALLVSSALGACPLLAPAAPAARNAAPPAGAPAAQSAETLDTLGNDKLQAELASRGLDDLLNRYYDVNKVPAAQRQAMKALGSLRDLTNPAAKLTPAEKQKRVRDVADGVDTILAAVHDPQKLMEATVPLIEVGVDRDVNTLEYWGNNPLTQARLKPVALAVYKLMGRAAENAAADADKLANQLRGANDPRADQWDKLDKLAAGAKYNQQKVAAYAFALATDAKDPNRKKLADEAIAYLAQFDNESSSVQAQVRDTIGKLNLVKGAYKEAKKQLNSVANDTKKEINPPPNPFEQYEARYFTAVADVEGQDLDSAHKDLDDLLKWQKETMPTLLAGIKLPAAEIENTRKGVEAAGEMLRYRVDLLAEAQAKTPDEKTKTAEAATNVLLKLRESQPNLAPIIDEQLVSRMSSDKPVAQLEPLLLQGLMTKGMAEYRKGEGEIPDAKVMDRAVEAAREIITRADRKGITPQNVQEASILIPTLQDRMGRAIEAGNGYLDYATKFFSANPALATQAVDRTGFLVFDTRKRQPVPDGFTDLYARFLKVAVAPPYNHKELAYLMGDHLQAEGKPKEALDYYRMVPPDNAAYLNAQYKQMLCLRDLLDGKTTPAEHQLYVDQLIKAADAVMKLGSASTKEVDRAKAVQSTLVSAHLARTEQNNPKASLQTLANFDALVKGLPGEKGLLNEALFERVQAYMALGQFDKATGDLVTLLNKTEGSEGMGLVRGLLEQLDKEYVKADLVHDTDAMRTVARNEAQLTGFLGDWARNNKDPNINKFYYAYVVYDARTKRLAGAMAKDPAERQKLMNETLELYKRLASPEMHKLYAQTLDPAKVKSGDLDPKDPDPSVQTGLAFTEFELGDYKGAQALLGDLLGNQKLGPPTVVENTPDGPKVKVNDLYWEATYKLLKCNAELARAGNDPKSLDNTRRGLKNILIRGGIPDRWQDEFESLRKDLIPDFNAGGATAAATPPAVTAQGK